MVITRYSKHYSYNIKNYLCIRRFLLNIILRHVRVSTNPSDRNTIRGDSVKYINTTAITKSNPTPIYYNIYI